MEANDSVLDAAPSSVRPILVLIINAVIPLITAAGHANKTQAHNNSALTPPKCPNPHANTTKPPTHKPQPP